MLNTDKDSSIILAGTTIYNPYNVIGDAKIYLENIETKKQEILTLDTKQTPIFMNIPAGTYKATKWIYNACQTREVDKYGNPTYCSSYYNFKGKSQPIKENQFEIKKGETLYLGHITLNSESKELTIDNQKNKDMLKLNQIIDLKGRKVKDIPNLYIKDWKFQITGTKGFFEL